MRGFHLLVVLFLVVGFIASESHGAIQGLRRLKRQTSGQASVSASTSAALGSKDDEEANVGSSTPRPAKSDDESTRRPKGPRKNKKKVNDDDDGDDEGDEEPQEELERRPKQKADRRDRDEAGMRDKKGRKSRTKEAKRRKQDDEYEEYEDCSSPADDDDEDDDDDYGLIHSPVNGFSRLMGSMIDRMNNAASGGKGTAAKAFSVSNGDGSSRSKSSVTTGGRTRGVELEIRRDGRSKIRRFDNRNRNRDDDDEQDDDNDDASD